MNAFLSLWGKKVRANVAYDYTLTLLQREWSFLVAYLETKVWFIFNFRFIFVIKPAAYCKIYSLELGVRCGATGLSVG